MNNILTQLKNKRVYVSIIDGPSVVLKLGKLVNTEHQLCYVPGIYLAVCDVLYSYKNV